MTELFLVNGRFHTQDPSYPRATAVAIRDGRLWAVGDDEEIRGLKEIANHYVQKSALYRRAFKAEA